MTQTDYWERCQWLCPDCSTEFDVGELSVPPVLELVQSGDPDIAISDVWGNANDDPVDPSLFRVANNTKPAVLCRHCCTLFDITFTPRTD